MDENPLESEPKSEALRTQVHENHSQLVKGLLVVAGTVSVALGVLGIVLPIVPTTPFLLLAAACYARSSERFYVALMTNRFFGPYIRDWREKRGLTLGMKLWIIFVLASTMGVSAIFFVPLLPVKVLLAIVGTGVSVYVLRLPTKPSDSTEKDSD